MNQFDIKTLIDPQAQVIDIHSSTRSIRLIHRALISHLVILKKQNGTPSIFTFEGEPFLVEYNSTAQLAEDIGHFLNNHPDA
jgi:hypothetical protein